MIACFEERDGPGKNRNALSEIFATSLFKNLSSRPPVETELR